jgi:hypothetical protein
MGVATRPEAVIATAAATMLARTGPPVTDQCRGISTP